MHNIRLVYFVTEGRAELTRMIFAQAGIEYTNERIQHNDWPSMKSSERFPFHQMPILEIDGVTIAQAGAITRCAASIAGLGGKTSLEQAQAEAVSDYLYVDLFEMMVRFAFEKDEEKKTELMKKFSEETVPKAFKNLEDLLVKAGGEYFIGYLTFADLGYYCFVNFLKRVIDVDKIAKMSPKLMELYNRVAALPNLKKYEETKPKQE